MLRRYCIGFTLLSLLFVGQVAGEDGARATWVATWSAAMQAPLFAPAQVIENQTVRQIVRASVGGSTLRVRFSNVIGTSSVKLTAASVGLRDRGPALQSGSARRLQFGGRNSITIPPGASVLSDPVSLDVPDQADLAVDLYILEPTAATTQLSSSHQTSYVSAAGDFTGRDLASPAPITSWYWLSGVEVRRNDARALVAFGDSITEGYGSTTDANSRWPDVLARRMLACDPKLAVVNTAISGNRILNDELGPNAQSRLDRDLLLQAGATFAILLEGINDIGFPLSDFLPESVLKPDVSADEIIAGYEQIIRRAHAQRIQLYAGTLLPYAGAAYYDAAGEAKRQAINAWIRTSGAFDGVVDFEAATRDPADPSRLLPAYDSGDHLHPNDAGYSAMGEAVDIGAFCGRAADGVRPVYAQ